jgi:bifunctional non-homologous end joining protein LigD
VIGGWSGTAANLRSLIVGVYRGDHLVHTGRVGTGFNQRNAGGLLKKLNALKTDKSPFAAISGLQQVAEDALSPDQQEDRPSLAPADGG